MLRTTGFDTLLGNCQHLEQIVDLCMRALYNSAYPGGFITTGIADDGSDIRSRMVQHWAGNQIVNENTMEEQLITTLVVTVDKEHKNSATPWLLVGLTGGATDTPTGPFA